MVDFDDLDWFDEDLPCLAREGCFRDLPGDASTDCLYCRLEILSDGDDE